MYLLSKRFFKTNSDQVQLSFSKVELGNYIEYIHFPYREYRENICFWWPQQIPAHAARYSPRLLIRQILILYQLDRVTPHTPTTHNRAFGISGPMSAHHPQLCMVEYAHGREGAASTLHQNWTGFHDLTRSILLGCCSIGVGRFFVAASFTPSKGTICVRFHCLSHPLSHCLSGSHNHPGAIRGWAVCPDYDNREQCHTACRRRYIRQRSGSRRELVSGTLGQQVQWP